MNLQDYLASKPFFRARRGIGTESDWLEFCALDVPSGLLFVFDPGFLPGELKGCRASVSSGHFVLSAKIVTYWKDYRVSRLRSCRTGAKPKLGSRVGSVVTDLGLIGAADHAIYASAWESDRAAFENTVSNEIPESGRYKIATLGAPPGVPVPFVESGFGDGRYSVYALVEEEARVGVEVVFIRARTPYPFLR